MGQTTILIGFITVLFLVILVSPTASSLQDVNFTIDNSGLDLCITADGLDNQVCNVTQVLTLDGTQDHFLYFTPKNMLSGNTTEDSKEILAPLNYLFTGNILYTLMFCLIIIAIFVKIMVAR